MCFFISKHLIFLRKQYNIIVANNYYLITLIRLTHPLYESCLLTFHVKKFIIIIQDSSSVQINGIFSQGRKLYTKCASAHFDGTTHLVC